MVTVDYPCRLGVGEQEAIERLHSTFFRGVSARPVSPYVSDGCTCWSLREQFACPEIPGSAPGLALQKHRRSRETSPERAAKIAVELCLPAEEFHWYKVSKDVGNVRNQGPALITPIEAASEEGK